MRLLQILVSAALPIVVCMNAGAQSTHKQSDKKTPAAAPVSPKAHAGPPIDETLLPSLALDFKKADPIPGVPGTHAIQQPILCSPDGIPIVAYPKFPSAPMPQHVTGADFMPTFYSFDPKGGHVFSPLSAPGIYDVWYRTYLVTNSIMGILVDGTQDDTKGTRTVSSPKGVSSFAAYTGPHHLFLLEYNLDGSFKVARQFPDGYQFLRIAPLPDDTFVALAYDTSNRVPRLLLLDSDLQVIRPLAIPSDLQDADPNLEKGETGDARKAAKAQTSLTLWQFAEARNRVLLYQQRRKAPVLEIGAGGVVREVPIQAPKGYVLADVIPANDRWLMQFFQEDLPQQGFVDLRPQTFHAVLYEVDPNDGSLRRRIDTPPLDKDHPGVQIACVQDGVINGFDMDDHGITRYSADLGR